MNQQFDPGQFQQGAEGAAVFGACFIFVMLLIAIALSALMIIIFWKICSKAGYSGALGLLILVPFGNLILLCMLAFADWPALKRMRQMEQTINPPPEQPQHESFRNL